MNIIYIFNRWFFIFTLYLQTVTGVWLCPGNHFLKRGQCIEVVGLRSPSKPELSYCYVKGSTCLQGFCMCKGDLIELENVCVDQKGENGIGAWIYAVIIVCVAVLMGAGFYAFKILMNKRAARTNLYSGNNLLGTSAS